MKMIPAYLVAVLALVGTVKGQTQARVVCRHLCVEDGTVSGGRSPGEKATVTCKTGYHVEGATTLTCGNDGKWSAAAPRCKPDVYCRSIPGISFGSVRYSAKPNLPDGSVTFSCEKGYKLVGESKLTCKSDGRWDKTLPRCIYSRCRVFRALYKGVVLKQNTLPGGSVTFKCNDGWKLNGLNTLTCGDDGEWKGEPPTCDYNQCKHLTQFPRGSIVKFGTLPGSIASFKCNPGHKLDGKNNIKCGADGKWESAFPVCRRDTSIPKADAQKLKGYNSCPFFNLRYGKCSGSGNKLVVGAALGCSCDDGYTLDGDSVLTCQDKLKWDKDYPKCVVNSCKPFEYIPNGRVKGGSRLPYTPGEGVNLECDDGFQMVGNSRVTCGSDLQFSELPQCVAAVCPHVPFFDNGRMVGYSNKQRGSVVTFVCNPGYKRLGENSLRCDANTTWSEDFPTCVLEPTCHVPCLKNGHFMESTKAGKKTVFYFCDMKYTLKGSSKLECEDGKWSDKAPVCDDSNGGSNEECTDTAIDIYIVADISLSIQDNQLEEEKTAIRFLFNGFNIDEGKSRVGLIKYHDIAEMEFKLGQYATKSKLSRVHILTRDLKSQKGGTRTDLAMNMMIDNFPKVEGRDRVGILLTDGKATAKLDDMIASLEKTDIKTIAIGIGRDCDYDELRAIATGPGSDNVYSARDFHELATIAPTLVDKVCELVKPTGIIVKPTGVLPVKPVEECKNLIVDVYFAADISKSIKDPELEQQKNALKYLIGGFDIAKDKSRVGLVTFGHSAVTEFSLGKYATREELNKVDILTRPPFKDLKGGTRTDQAIEEVISNFEKEKLAGRANVLIVMTDGKATEPLTAALDKLRKTDIKTIAIGVGSGAEISELSNIATGKGMENVYFAKDFKALDTLINSIVTKICKEEQTGGSTD